MAKVKKIRVRLQAYDHKILDMSVSKIVNDQFHYQQKNKFTQS